MAGGRVVGVRIGRETISVDIAILANEFEARSLAAKVGLELPLAEALTVLVRYAAEPGLIRHLLYGWALKYALQWAAVSPWQPTTLTMVRKGSLGLPCIRRLQSATFLRCRQRHPSCPSRPRTDR